MKTFAKNVGARFSLKVTDNANVANGTTRLGNRCFRPNIGTIAYFDKIKV